ncbi:MAG: ClpXP protease specificity-enhancing factor SspB [Alphaproteobacteria bacterium]
MAKDFFQYDRMVAEALCDVVRKVLKRTAQHGLRGNHHLYLTFKTGHPEVVLPDYLRSQFPNDMTIVLQHEFWGLTIYSDHFEVTLSFNDIHERMHIPFAALTSFADPSVQFGLQLQPPTNAQDLKAPAKPAAPEAPDAIADAGKTPMPAQREAETHGGGKPDKIVSLDAFRKK